LHLTAVSQDLTDKIDQLTVDLYKYKAAFNNLSNIVEDIIKSPNKAHWKFLDGGCLVYFFKGGLIISFTE